MGILKHKHWVNNNKPTIELIRAFFIGFKLQNAKSCEEALTSESRNFIKKLYGYGDDDGCPRGINRGAWWSATLAGKNNSPSTREDNYDDAEHHQNHKARVLAFSLYLADIEMPNEY